MTIDYEFLTDEPYYRTLIDRYYQQQPFLLRLVSQFSIAPLAFAAISTYGWLTNADWKVVISVCTVLIGFISLGAVRLTKYSIYQRLISSRQFGNPLRASLSPQGLSFSGLAGHKDYAWNQYPRSVRFPDGILLLKPGKISWLPDAALKESDPDAAIAVVKAMTRFRLLPNNSFKPKPLRGSA